MAISPSCTYTWDTVFFSGLGEGCLAAHVLELVLVMVSTISAKTGDTNTVVVVFLLVLHCVVNMS